MTRAIAHGHGAELAALADIAARATTLEERIRQDCHDSQGAERREAETALLLDVWRRTCSSGSSHLFSRRLAWDWLDAAALTLTPPPPSADALPSWLDLLSQAYGWGPAGLKPQEGHADTTSEPVTAAPQQRLAFEELFVPLVQHARREIARRAGSSHGELTAAAHGQTERALLSQLSHLCEQSLYPSFLVFRSALAPCFGLPGGQPGRTRYLAFIERMKDGGLLAFLREHSVVARLCATTTRNWIDFVVEFLDRLRQDRPELERRFGDGGALGPICSVDLGLSDAHDGGRGVIICQTAGGQRVVYKPRPLGLEEFFAELVRWTNERADLLPLRAVQVVSRPTHGWVEWIPPLPCQDQEQVARYYRRCGMLLALLHGIHGTDFHRENLLGSGEHPVLIDAETLLSQRFLLEPVEGAGPRPVTSADGPTLTESTLRVFMLPHLQVTADGQAGELGALLIGPPDQPTGGLGWCDVNTDVMRLGKITLPRQPPPRNVPLLEGRPIVAAGHVEEVVAGFRQMYRALLARRHELLAPDGLINRLGPQPVRFIFRNTSLYAALLRRTLHPSYLRDGVARSLELDVLSRPLLERSERPAVWPLLAAERRALEQMDVPLFATRADARSVELRTGETAECFSRSAVEEARRKLLALSESELPLEESAIRAAFAAVAAPGLRATVTGDPSARPASLVPDRAACLAELERLASSLASEAQTADGIAFWLAPAYMSAPRRHNPAARHPNLLDGNAGVGLALAAAARVTGREDLAAVARSALELLCGPLGDLPARLARGTLDAGLGTGLASLAYAALRSGELLGDPALTAAARKLALWLEPAALPARGPHDLLAGQAGALLLLVRMHEATGGDRPWLQRAEAFADHLLARRVTEPTSGLRVWADRRGRVEPGLAHGQSGIAVALAQLALHDGRVDLLAAAREAIHFERRLLGPELAAPADLDAAWSHGSSGLGLARVALLRCENDRQIRADLEATLERCRAHLLDGSDTLGTGTLGRAELLLEAAEILDRPALRAEAHHAIGAVVARGRYEGRYRLGWHGGYQHPGLYQGLAGIAYGLARRLDPAHVPSLACWA